jgi:hypothetical protein
LCVEINSVPSATPRPNLEAVAVQTLFYHTLRRATGCRTYTKTYSCPSCVVRLSPVGRYRNPNIPTRKRPLRNAREQASLILQDHPPPTMVDLPSRHNVATPNSAPLWLIPNAVASTPSRRCGERRGYGSHAKGQKEDNHRLAIEEWS